VVAMFINNSPEFVFAWWALFKIGAIPAPINTSISQEPFRHCLNISEAKYLICSSELIDIAIVSTDVHHAQLPNLETTVIYDYGTYSNEFPSATLNTEIIAITHSQLSAPNRSMAEWQKESRPKVGPQDTSQYLFTSGTTGLPKASAWPCGHSLMCSSPYRWPQMFKKKRRVYLCTPLFHGGAAYALLPAAHSSGGTVILARKLSVRQFWPDVRRTSADMIFYIGEMVRYLTQAPLDPYHPDETKANGLEVIYGLGIVEPVWKKFRTRFGVPWIAEYYGATEGTAAISNSNHSNDRGVAKVAHFGPLMRNFGQETFYIIRIDFDTGEVVRDPKTGLCIQAEWNEVGEAVNRIVPPLQRRHDYVGEGGPEATEKKTIQDVFKKGDLFWRMGDALSMVTYASLQSGLLRR
jgi:acyl-CoA synthetase (AMP-forming)/AMP-acid ligase II